MRLIEALCKTGGQMLTIERKRSPWWDSRRSSGQVWCDWDAISFRTAYQTSESSYWLVEGVEETWFCPVQRAGFGSSSKEY